MRRTVVKIICSPSVQVVRIASVNAIAPRKPVRKMKAYDFSKIKLPIQYIVQQTIICHDLLQLSNLKCYSHQDLATNTANANKESIHPRKSI